MLSKRQGCIDSQMTGKWNKVKKINISMLAQP